MISIWVWLVTRDIWLATRVCSGCFFSNMVCEREFEVYEGCENNELSGQWWPVGAEREICKRLGAIGGAFDDDEDRKEGWFE